MGLYGMPGLFRGIKIPAWENASGADEKNHKKYYENRMKMTFEGISCMVPRDYDEKLQGIYCDYRKLPLEEERRGHDYVAYYRKERKKCE